ncbi:MAG TPA: MarR family transcriptional regulator, partial [Burkholderiales bacterium]|nr:MarR family transcriptional regulator [Burkholderiales bacterium]
EVLELFRIVFKSIQRHYKSVRSRAGIGGAQLWALAQVAACPGIKVGQLAQALAVHQSTASNLIRDLEGSGMLARRRQGEDQRMVRLYATSKGLIVLKRAPRPLIGVLQQALSDLPTSDLDALHRHLGLLVASMRGTDRSARGTPLSEL